MFDYVAIYSMAEPLIWRLVDSILMVNGGSKGAMVIYFP